ncbi:hypothetical protein [Marinicella sp. W31]|uniref:hypothetical protein n=1 Tax=Marinicella sp. W31 TaxID=3023713 RepID=UPI0037572777
MNKHPDQLEITMLDYVCGHMTADQQAEFEQFLTRHPEHQTELEALRQSLQWIDDDSQQPIPEPSNKMDAGFYHMLGEAQKQQENSLLKKISRGWKKLLSSSYFKPALSGVSMLVVGFFVGSLYTQQSDLDTLMMPQNTTANINTGNQQMFQEMSVSLLGLPSANKRLQAVNLIANSSAETNSIQPIVLSALLETLNNDSNVNVRLAVVETLSQYADSAAVRQGLIGSIPRQQSPLVQIALANLMLKLNEKEAIKPLQELLEGEQLIEPVKDKLTYAVNELI